MATCRFDIFDSTNQLYELGNVHHTLGVPHYTADPFSPFEGTFRLRRQGGKGRFLHRTNVRTDSRPAEMFHWQKILQRERLNNNFF